MRSFNDIQVYKYTQKGMEESFEIPTNVQNGKKRKKKNRSYEMQPLFRWFWVFVNKLVNVNVQ